MKSQLEQVLETRAVTVSHDNDIPLTTLTRIRRGRRAVWAGVTFIVALASVGAVGLASRLDRGHSLVVSTTSSWRYLGVIDLDPHNTGLRPYQYNVSTGRGYFWINTGRGVVRFDPTRKATAFLDAPSALHLPSFASAIESLVVSDQGVWLFHQTLRGSSTREAVSLVDFTSGRLVASILLPKVQLVRGHSDRPIAIDSVNDRVWVANGGAGNSQAVLIAEHSHRLLRTLLLGPASNLSLAITTSGAWITTDLGLVHLSRQGVVLGVIRELLNAYGQTVVDDNTVWLTTGEDGMVKKVDSRASIVTKRVRLAWPSAIAFGNGAVWVLDDSETVVRIDPTTNHITDRFKLPALIRGPASMAVINGYLVITSMNDARAFYFAV